jgi:[ribosomal protein S18]-alanine N-acetyltransferase
MNTSVQRLIYSQVKTSIRLMRIDDLPQVQVVDELSFSNPWPKNAYHFELLENPNGHCWVAETDGRIVGMIVCWLIIDEMHIATIAVHPDCRQQGIGKQLVIAALKALIPQGALSATLEVRAGNIMAQNLYRYFGFRNVGLRKGYYKDSGEDALLLTVEPLTPDYLSWLNAGAENPWVDGCHP